MNSWERLEAVFAGRDPDHTPILGGWIACPQHICKLAGVELDAYWADPIGVSIEAYRALGSDGLVGVFVPSNREDFRCVDEHSYKKADEGISPEDAIARIGAMPSPEEIEAAFDFENEYAAFCAQLIQGQERCGEMVSIPAQWAAASRCTWYAEFGYETFFLLTGLRPELVIRLFQIGGANGHNRSRLVARAVDEGLFPHACFLGEDICTQRGPMISPEFLREHYAPTLEHSLQPLLDSGCRPVWHCDGDVRPLLDMLLDCGVQGFQGFQPECGMHLEEIVQLRPRDGKRLIIFGPLAVTTELPVDSVEETKARVRRAVDVCRDRAGLVLFTSNTINPDIPLDNIVAMHEAAKEQMYGIERL